MEPATYEFCTKVSYVAIVFFMAVLLLVLIPVCLRNYWDDQDKKIADSSRCRRAEKRFSKERENWIGIISDLHDKNEEMASEISYLTKEVERLEMLLQKSEELRRS